MRDKKRILTVLVVAVLLLGAAITFVLAGRGEQLEQANIPEPVEAIAVVDTAVPTTEVLEETVPPQTEVEEEQAEPTPRVGLEATDPAIVNLASGDIQLIEAFAFW